MREHNSKKKEWISATLMTSAIFAGLFAGGGSHREPSVFAQTDESSMLSESSDKAASESGKKAISSYFLKTKSITIKKSESKIKAKPSAKAKLSTRAAGYVGPANDVIPQSSWDTTKDYAAESATAFVSQSGRTDRPDDPVMYFGNSIEPFQPSELTNNNDADSNNLSSWSHTYTTGKNPRPSIIHGLIRDNQMARKYRANESDPVMAFSGIEGGIRDKSITDYHLYKNHTNTGFKATMYDTSYKVSYTFESVYSNRGGVYRYFSITNNDSVQHQIGAMEVNDTYVDSDKVRLYSLGPNAGFNMLGTEFGGIHSLSLRLNDPVTEARLGGWTNYTAGLQTRIMDSGNLPYYFTGTTGLTGTGKESLAAGKDISVVNIKDPGLMPAYSNNAYAMKANAVALVPGATLVNGSYLTYKQGTPSAAPVATVKTATINGYSDQKSVVITGSVSDADDTKGNIEIGYPDGTSEKTPYDTKQAYSAPVDMSRLSPGKNELLVTAIDPGNNRQEKPVTVTVNVFKLGATAIPQTIAAGDTVKTGETDLINNLTIINQPTVNAHTLKIDTTNPSGKPLINTKAGYYIQDMLLTDTVVKPNEIAKVAVPVTVTDSDTAFDKTSALYAKGFDVKQVDIQKLTTTELNTFILKTSEAKSWLVTTGAESKVSVASTTLKPTSIVGSYQAVIKNSNGLTKTINIGVTGGLKITSAPTATDYGSSSGVMLPYSGENFELQRSDSSTNSSVDISNTGKQAWTLTARLTKPLTNSNNDKLTGIFEYVNSANGVQDIESNSAEVGSGQSEATQEVRWDKDKGIIAQLNGGNTSLKAGAYTGEITWTLEDTP
ncbi:hypothetical protein ACE83Q_00545 [Dellaglioa sp. P0083]|uniref:hypothetical protein n=1 Tax=Dellaglioa kimchii TaxID=3344667 RepID=UPI0038D511EC